MTRAASEHDPSGRIGHDRITADVDVERGEVPEILKDSVVNKTNAAGPLLIMRGKNWNGVDPPRVLGALTSSRIPL